MRGIRRDVGGAWIQSTANLGLWVPSVVEPARTHLLINPVHLQYASIAVVKLPDFAFDPRLF
jgi:RES domain-containing protein